MLSAVRKLGEKPSLLWATSNCAAHLISNVWFLCSETYILRNGGKAWKQNCPTCDFLTYNQLSAHWLQTSCVNMSVKSFNLSGGAATSLNPELAGNNRGEQSNQIQPLFPQSNLSFSLYSRIRLCCVFQPLASSRTVCWILMKMCKEQSLGREKVKQWVVMRWA